MNAPYTPGAPGAHSRSRRLVAQLRAGVAKAAGASARWMADLASKAQIKPGDDLPATLTGSSPIPTGKVALAADALAGSTSGDAGEIDLATLLGEPGSKDWRKRPAVWVGAAAILLAAGALWWWLASHAADATPTYSTQAAALGNVTLKVSANGTIQPTRTISIGSELSGTVLQVNVDVNDRVRRGQVLVVLDTAKLQDQILRSRASLAAAIANLALATATIAEARANFNRLEEVSRISGGRVPSRAELDTGRATLARAVASGASARAGIQDARAALSTDEINLSKASITAPADGVVLTRNVDPGNAVAASLQAVTLFTLADDLTRLRLWVYVDEADVGSVQVGQDATFTVSAFPNRRFPARITRVGFGSTITDNVVTYLTYLDVDNSDMNLRPGMTATATIIATKRTNVLLVPNTALRFTPTVSTPTTATPASGGLMSSLTPRIPGANRPRAAANGNSAASTAGARRVWVLRGRVPVAVEVTTGVSDGHMTEITGGRLQVGMLVITDQRTAQNTTRSP